MIVSNAYAWWLKECLGIITSNEVDDDIKKIVYFYFRTIPPDEIEKLYESTLETDI